VWKPQRQVANVPAGCTLRIQAASPFRLRWTQDEWRTSQDIASSDSGLGIGFVDIAVDRGQQAPLRFTFFWTGRGEWEGRDYAVGVR
jgi:glucoamylase